MDKQIFIDESLLPMYDLGTEDKSLKGILTCGYSEADIKEYMTDYYHDKNQVMKHSYDLVPFYKTVFENALSKVKCTDIRNVLELGCGYGYSTYAVAELLPNASIVASELSAAMLARHKQYGEENYLENEERIVRCQINADQKIFKDNSFDMVFGTAILRHVFDPLKIIKEAGRILRPGGIAVFCEPFEAGYGLLQLVYEMLLLNHEETPFLTNEQFSYLKSSLEAWACIRVNSPHEKEDIHVKDGKWLFPFEYFDEAATIAGFDLIRKIPITNGNHVFDLYRAHTSGNGIELPAITETILGCIERSFSANQLQNMPGDGVLILQKRSEDNYSTTERDYSQDIAYFRHTSLLISNLSDEYARKFQELQGVAYKETKERDKKSFSIMKPVFHTIRRIAEKLHIKERLKKTSLYKRLFLKGVMDKLQ